MALEDYVARLEDANHRLRQANAEATQRIGAMQSYIRFLEERLGYWTSTPTSLGDPGAKGGEAEELKAAGGGGLGGHVAHQVGGDDVGEAGGGDEVGTGAGEEGEHR